MQDGRSGASEAACVAEERSIARGSTREFSASCSSPSLLMSPFRIHTVSIPEDGLGLGNRKVNASPSSVAAPTKGMTKRSMPSEICSRIWCGEDGSSRESRGRRDSAVVAGMSGSNEEE